MVAPAGGNHVVKPQVDITVSMVASEAKKAAG